MKKVSLYNYETEVHNEIGGQVMIDFDKLVKDFIEEKCSKHPINEVRDALVGCINEHTYRQAIMQRCNKDKKNES